MGRGQGDNHSASVGRRDSGFFGPSSVSASAQSAATRIAEHINQEKLPPATPDERIRRGEREERQQQTLAFIARKMREEGGIADGPGRRVKRALRRAEKEDRRERDARQKETVSFIREQHLQGIES